MGEVKRYYPYSTLEGVAKMAEVHPHRPTEDGHYFSAADYSALKAQADRMAEALEKLQALNEKREREARKMESMEGWGARATLAAYRSFTKTAAPSSEEK